MHGIYSWRVRGEGAATFATVGVLAQETSVGAVMWGGAVWIVASTAVVVAIPSIRRYRAKPLGALAPVGRRMNANRGEHHAMNLGLRSILLLVAVVLFVVAVLSDTNWNDLVAWGLAAFAASFLVGDANLGSFGPRNRR